VLFVVAAPAGYAIAASESGLGREMSERGFALSLVDAGVQWQNSSGEGVIAWGRFLSWRETKAAFVLAYGFWHVVIPKRDFSSPDDEARARARFTRSIER
jgi:hypothetical protein